MATATAAANECQQSPRLVGKCFRVHGPLGAWNGNPTFRIWRVGTTRVLGLDAAGGDGADPRPPAVAAAMGADAFSTSVWGDYRVCPFTRSRSGRMQLVCVAGASRLVARPR